MNYSPKYFKQNFPEWKRKKDALPIKIFIRPVSFYFSSLFYKLGFTSNQVSFLSLFVGIGGCLCFFFANMYIQLLGAALITVWAILDAVDGNLARNVKSYPYGDFIDSMSSYTIVALIFPIIGFTVYREGGHFVDAGNGAIILLGAFASIFDTLARLIYQKFQNVDKVMVESGKVVKNESTDFNSGSKLYKINDFVSQELGLAGIFQWAIYVCVLFTALDILILFYLLYYGFTMLTASFMLIYKSKCLLK